MKTEIIGKTTATASALNPVESAAAAYEANPSVNTAVELGQTVGRCGRLWANSLLLDRLVDGPELQGVRFTLADGREMEITVRDPRDPAAVAKLV